VFQLASQTPPTTRSMEAVAQDPHASLCLTESSRQAAIRLQATRTKSREGSEHGGDDGAIPEVDRQSLSTVRSSAGSVDIEKKFTSWLCVLSAFLFLAPSYGENGSVPAVNDQLVLTFDLQVSCNPSARCSPTSR